MNPLVRFIAAALALVVRARRRRRNGSSFRRPRSRSRPPPPTTFAAPPPAVVRVRHPAGDAAALHVATGVSVRRSPPGTVRRAALGLLRTDHASHHSRHPGAPAAPYPTTPAPPPRRSAVLRRHTAAVAGSPSPLAPGSVSPPPPFDPYAAGTPLGAPPPAVPYNYTPPPVARRRRPRRRSIPTGCRTNFSRRRRAPTATTPRPNDSCRS